MALGAALLRPLAARLPDRASTRAADLDAAARDASSLPGARPDAVVWPLATDDVVAVVKLAAAHAIPLTARGAGSSLEGNPIPVRGGIVLDVSRMAEVVAIRPEDLQVDVQPGVVYAALNRQLRPHGLFFPPSPGGSADVATIGGMAANNASGIYSVKYGGTRDHVRAATVVTGTGEVLRLGNRARKSASGYHLLGLVVGSEGTLAIVTELTLALAGLPQARRQGGFRFPDTGGDALDRGAPSRRGHRARRPRHPDRRAAAAGRALRGGRRRARPRRAPLRSRRHRHTARARARRRGRARGGGRGARRARGGGTCARRVVLGRARDGARQPALRGARARRGARPHAGGEAALRPARDSQSRQDVVRDGACGSSCASSGSRRSARCASTPRPAGSSARACRAR